MILFDYYRGMYTMNRILLKTILLVFVLSGKPVLAEQSSPGDVVRDIVDRVLQVLDDSNLTEDQKQQTIYTIASSNIDFREMSQRILAVNWRQASDTDKERFVSLYEKILLGDYWTRIRNYSGERVQYLSVSIEQENYATVDTVITHPDGEVEIPITYRMLMRDGQWFAYDFLVEGLSLVQNYRREYLAIIKNSGMEGLLQYMETQI